LSVVEKLTARPIVARQQSDLVQGAQAPSKTLASLTT
jgi:hypothetical protein